MHDGPSFIDIDGPSFLDDGTDLCWSTWQRTLQQIRTDCKPGISDGEFIGKSGSRRALTTAAASMKRSSVQACGMLPPIASKTGARLEC